MDRPGGIFGDRRVERTLTRIATFEDQPGLHGVLVKVRDLGQCLISVRRLNPDGTGETPSP